MKAIQVRYLGMTNTKPSRYKITAEGLPTIIMSCDSFIDHPYKSIECQAAEVLANKYNWLNYNSYTECDVILRGGQIANGDHVFVLVDIPFNIRKSFIEFKRG